MTDTADAGSKNGNTWQDDSVEVFVDDARAMVDAARDQFGVEWDEALVRLFARESAQTYRILTERGVRFSRFIPRPRQHTVDRMAAVEDSWMLGRAFVADFERDNVTVAYRTVADRLVVENGRVSGVLAHRADGGQVTLREPAELEIPAHPERCGGRGHHRD